MLGSVSPDLYSGICLQNCILNYYTVQCIKLPSTVGLVMYHQPGFAILLGRTEAVGVKSVTDVGASQ